ncbi:MAG: ribosome small subunit-dependent GTPase A, partial [Chloroflexi bacterium HGW-Chloroflexi-9]
MGWDERLQARFASLDLPDTDGLQPGRIARVDRGAMTVLIDHASIRAELSP